MLPTREGQAARDWGDSGELDEKAWWPKEKRLDPPRALLEYLVRELPTEPGRSSTVPDRDKLLAGDEEALAKALTALGGQTTSHGEREVVAFFAVEGDDPDPTSVPEHWKQAVDATVSEDALAGSLPHRTEDVRREMARAFRGAVTWQAICDVFSLPRDILIDEVPQELR